MLSCLDFACDSMRTLLTCTWQLDGSCVQGDAICHQTWHDLLQRFISCVLFDLCIMCASLPINLECQRIAVSFAVNHVRSTTCTAHQLCSSSYRVCGKTLPSAAPGR